MDARAHGSLGRRRGALNAANWGLKGLIVAKWFSFLAAMKRSCVGSPSRTVQGLDAGRWFPLVLAVGISADEREGQRGRFEMKL